MLLDVNLAGFVESALKMAGNLHDLWGELYEENGRLWIK